MQRNGVSSNGGSSEMVSLNGAPEKVESSGTEKTGATAAKSEITPMGLKVLALLAVQNCTKNLITRYVMQDAPQFLLSAAVVGSELTKFTLSTLFIVCVERRHPSTILTFLKEDWNNTKLLVVPATVYNIQQTLELIALSNLDASIFSVLVQSKLLMTAIFSVILLSKKLKKIQVISLVMLTVGVVLCNLKESTLAGGTSNVLEEETGGFMQSQQMKGVAATIGISLASGFAAVYTEKVIKKKRTPPPGSTLPSPSSSNAPSQFGLAYMQVQLSLVSLTVMGAYAISKDADAILKDGLFQNFTPAAVITVVNSGIGGLMVAAVLKYADAVLKGYATAISVILTGSLSHVLFGTDLGILYLLGIVNVISAVLLYNANDLDRYMC